MAKVISTLFISADGVAEIDPDWHFPYFDENMGRAVTEDYDTSDLLLIGRETYDSFAGAWPGRETAGGVLTHRRAGRHLPGAGLSRRDPRRRPPAVAHGSVGRLRPAPPLVGSRSPCNTIMGEEPQHHRQPGER